MGIIMKRTFCFIYTAALFLFVSSAHAQPVSPGPVIILGPEEIVFDWTTDRCEIGDFPDFPARAFRDADGKVQLIATYIMNRRMIGDDLASVKRDCNVIMSSDMDADPAKYNDKEWISAVYTLDGVHIHALVHNEYQGNTHPGMCPSGNYFDCWYNSITYAFSTDKGQTYTHAPAPEHRVANVPYKYVDGAGPYGIFSGSNIIRNPKDGYYYKILQLEEYGEQDHGTGVMRTQTLNDPSSWRCWDGEAFNVTFIDPYTEENYDPADHICEPVSRENIGKTWANLTYNTFFNKFLIIGEGRVYDPDHGEIVYGFCYSLSDDLINWSPLQLIKEAKLFSMSPSLPGDYCAYPSLIDPDDDSMNFEYTDQQAYLYYSRLNEGLSSPDWDLVRIPIKFTVKGSDFSAVPTIGKAPLKVQFYDRSIGDITSWSWNFGDGSTSTEQNPIHTYENIGTYSVSLSVWWSGGSDIETKNNYVKVKEFITMPAIPLLLLDD